MFQKDTNRHHHTSKPGLWQAFLTKRLKFETKNKKTGRAFSQTLNKLRPA